ncbi:MAG TPA: hypothetical protein VJU84_11920 [Pyrinomonadaceae bacterium]|nr:hypothetical protein [Pyrinomonadaceae bacterium]
MNKIGYPFLVIAIAFVALGISGQRTFLYVGVVFLLIGIALLARSRRR